MELSLYLSRKPRGEAARLARQTGIKPQNISAFAANRKKVSIKAAKQIEDATKGAVTRKELRPDDWFDIWPELAEK